MSQSSDALQSAPQAPARSGADLPNTGWLADLSYNLIWASRFVMRDEELLADFERDVQQWVLQESEPHGEGPVSEVLRLRSDDADPATWRRMAARGVPIVIEGFLRDARPVREWSLDWLKERCGDSEIHVMHDEAAEADYGTKHYHVCHTSASRVADLVDSVRAGGSAYAAGTANIFRDHPELIDDLDLDRFERSFGCTVIRPEVFIAGPQSTTYFHCATAGNYFCQIHGRKKWVLVAPWHSKWMYPNIGFSQKGVYFASPIVSARQAEDPERYPLYNYVPKQEVVLEPGDVLYNPPWWWHEVSNLTETIGVPLRTNEFATSLTTNFLYNSFFYTTPTLLRTSLTYLTQTLWNPFGRNLLLSDDEIRDALVTRQQETESPRIRHPDR